MLNEEVQHWLPPGRDVFGAPIESGKTTHPARIVSATTKATSSVSRADFADAKAQIWLIDHPRPIVIGDVFDLPDISSLKAIRVETRTMATFSLHKVWLS